jgi:phospholipid/cholesterol/gamma-HCH transport system substrate-binding protein
VTKLDVKVGIFVLFGFALAGLVVFMIGNERRFFETSSEFGARFTDVQGLSRGAPVHMGGVRVGQVTAVAYGSDAADTKIYVKMDIVDGDARRIRTDSKAKIVNKGLLGDKMVVVIMGKAAETIEPGGIIPSEEPDDFMGRVDEMAAKAELTMSDVSAVAENLANEDLHRDIRQSARSLNLLLAQMAEGEGYVNRFITDKGEADRISATIDTLNTSAVELNATLREVRMAVRQVRTGPGFAHDVLYGEGLAPQAKQVGNAAEEVALTLRGVRQGDGFAHDLLYGGKSDTKDAITNVTQLTADLRDIVRGVKKGNGTIGALLVDPSIYEDLKRVLGNVERNAVLRSLVRYSIKKDQGTPKVEVGAKSP